MSVGAAEILARLANLGFGGRLGGSQAGQLRTGLFRPFCKRNLCFNSVLVERRYQFPHIFPTQEAEAENRRGMIACLHASVVAAALLERDQLAAAHAVLADRIDVIEGEEG